MKTRSGTPEDLARLRHERDAAERQYGEALTALDAAVHRLREFPTPPAQFDDSQITPLNQQWELLKLKPAESGGWLRRIREHMWAMVSPLFARQEAFNAAIVDHINRNAASQRQTAAAIADTITAVKNEFERLVDFETKLILWAQQITAYVDTKDRYVAGLPSGLAAAIGGLSEELHRHRESMASRERRYQSQVEEVRTSLAVVHGAVQTMKRELEQGLQGARPGAAPPSEGRAEDGGADRTAALNAYKYVGFEDRFRGDPEDIRLRQAAYVPLFQGASDVLDVGCGRGEFLDLLRHHGIPARGVDLNEEMAAICRTRGLEATAGEALAYLEAQPDGSIGGLFAAQVVEHLEPAYLMRLLDAAFRKMRPGSKIVLETINPACWYAFFSSYIRDLTHVRPLHPDTLQYLLVASGFHRTSIRYAAPFPEEAKLQPIRLPELDDDPETRALRGAARVFNDNVTLLNNLLFTHLDYAAIGERL